MPLLVTLGSFDAELRDRYPVPGTRIKQYVIDERNRDAWERETCPRLEVPDHNEDHDDSEATSGDVVQCPSVGVTSWLDIMGRDSSCRFCEGFGHAARRLPEMVAWFAARDQHHAEHPICADRSQLSDEVAPEFDLRRSPLLAMLPKRSA